MKKPTFNWRITVPISSIVLLAAIGFGVFFIGKMFASDILNELVVRETKGYYQLDFKELKLNPFKKRITVNDLVLRPDESKNFAELGLTNLYEIELGQLVIDFESIYGFYFDKELDISNVRIVDPYINMVKLKASKGTKFSMEAGDLYQAISDYLEVLKIDYFHIQDGALDYSQNDFSLGNIDFVVQNLLMDSTNRQNKVFYSESIELEVRNQKFNLPDGIHTIMFESFLLSTKDSVLRFKNFQLVPSPESGVTFEGDNEVNVYNIQVPELSLKGIDYVAAYQENKLRVEELFLKEPTVFLDDESHGEQKTREDDNSVMALIFQVFSSLEVGKLIIEQAHIDLKLDGQKNYQRLKAEETNMIFEEIRIDTSNYRFHSRHQYFKNIVLDLHNYEYFLPDSVHVAAFDLLRLNSLKEQVLLQNLTISPKLAHDSDFTTFEMLIPALAIRGVDFRQALTERRLEADTMSLAITLLESENRKSQGKKGGGFDIGRLHQVIKPYFESVDVGKILLRGRKWDPVDALHIGAIDMEVDRLRLNARTKSWTDFIGALDVDMSDFKLDQDSLKIDGAAMNGNLNSFFLADWRVNVNNSKQKINGKVDTLRISGVTIDSVMRGKANYFTRAELIRPVVQFDLISGDSSGKFEDHIEKELLVVDANISGTYDDWTFSIQELTTDVFEGDSTAFRSLESRNIDVKNEGLNHRLAFSRWNYDTLGGEMDFHDLRITPLKQDSSKSLLDASVGFIGLKDFEQAQFFNHQHLILSELKILDPDIKLFLTQNTGAKAPKEEGKLTAEIEKVLFDTAYLEVMGLGPELQKVILQDAVVELSALNYPGDLIGPDRFLFSENAEIDIASISPKLASGMETEVVGFSYSSSNKALKIDSVALKSKDGRLKSTLINTGIEGFNLEALQRGDLIGDSIRVGKVYGENHLVKRDNPNGEFSHVGSVSIKAVSLPEIQWEIIDDENEKAFDLNDAYIEVRRVESNDTLRLENLPNRIEQFRFGGKDFSVPLNQGYTFDVGSYEVNHPSNLIDLKEVKLNTSYSKEEFSEIIDSQTDWFDLSVEQVAISPKDFSEMISGNNYHLEQVNVNGLDALIYRDKNVAVTEQIMHPLPQSELRNLKIPLQIDSLVMNGDLIYQEKAVDGDEAGVMTFNDLDLRLSNVKTRPEQNEIMKMISQGNLMNSGAFKVDGQFQLNNPYDQFSLTGSLADFQLDSLNRMLMPVANVRVNKGFADQLFFNFIANDTLAQGEMRFKYNDLRIRIMNAKTHEKGGLGTGIKSFFANTFVVKRKNPTFLFLRKGTIFYHRDNSKAIFNYWAKSLLSGSVSSIGIHKSDKEEKKFERFLDARKED